MGGWVDGRMDGYLLGCHDASATHMQTYTYTHYMPTPLISHTPLHGLLPGIGMHRDRYTGDGQPVRPAGLDPPH